MGAQFLKIPAHIFTYLLGQAEHRLWQQAGRRMEPVPPAREEWDESWDAD